MLIREADARHAESIAEIYNFYVQTSHATFEIDIVDAAEMTRRIRSSIDNGYPFLAAEDGQDVIGYAYGQGYRSRAAYSHSVEISVYVRDGWGGQGIATSLYRTLLPMLIDSGFHAIIAGISLPNEASVRLHDRFAFEKVAHFREVGRKFDHWIDVGYWQLLTKGRDPALAPIS